MLEKFQKIFGDFSSDEIMTRASSLAYYSALAIAPLVVLYVWALSAIGPEFQAGFVDNVRSLMGEDAAKVVASIVEGSTKRPDLSSLSGWIGLAGLLFSASVIFGELQSTLNLVFDVEIKEEEKKSIFQSVKGLLIDRLFSIGMLLIFIFISTTSLGVSSALAYLFIGAEGGFLHAAILLVNFVVFTGLFALTFKFMPDRKTTFKAAAIGGAITAVLFAIGNLGLSFYLSRASVGSAYGAAGSFAVLLVWLYYSAVIFYLGAEVSYSFVVAGEKDTDKPGGALSPSPRLHRSLDETPRAHGERV